MSISDYKKPDIQTDFSSLPNWLYLLVVVVLYAFGAFSFFDYILDPENANQLETLSEGFSILVPIAMPFMLLLLSFIVIFIFITIILAYVIVWIMSKVAQEVTIAVSILFPLLLVLIGALIIGGGVMYSGDVQSGVSLFGIVLAGIGILLLIFVIWKFQLIKRSGQFVEFSAQLVLDEKAVLAMPIFLGIFSIITGFFMLFGFIKIGDILGGQNLWIPVAMIFEYVYLIVYFGVYYSFSAGVVSYASDWYRGLDPDLSSAIRDVRQVFPIILKFAFAMATIRVIMQFLKGASRDVARQTRRSRSTGGSVLFAVIAGAVAGVFISIVGAIWMFLNYFTLVSIVQNKKGLKDSIKDSAYTTWNSLLDVLVGESGFGLTTFIFALINSLIWIVVGFGVGLFVAQDLVFAAIFAFIFLFLGFLPYNVVTMPMSVAFRTFMYSYAKDTVEGYTKPSRLPAELRTEFKTLAGFERRKRGMRDPNRYF